LKPLHPNKAADPAFVRALTEIAARIAGPLARADSSALPVTMFLAGGAAVHLYTGARATDDVDAVFSTRVMLPEDLDVYYVSAQGENRLLYFDRQYNDTLGLVHEDARDDALPLTMLGVDPRVLDVRVLTPLDLAVSKIGRFEDRDRDDIAALARTRLIDSAAVRRRATEALASYVGSLDRVRTSIELACRLVDADATAAVKPARKGRASKRSR
jgi:hypothetical protein